MHNKKKGKGRCKMKKAIIFLGVFFTIALIFSAIYNIYKNPKYLPSVEEAKLESQVRTNTIASTGSIMSIKQNDIIETSVSDEKVSPNATLIIKKHYKKCGHTTEDYASVPEEVVNKTEDEVKKIYSDWKIERFSENELVLYKELTGICKEHYILKEHNGVIGIYTLNDSDEKIFQEDTSIATEYLPEEDFIRIQEGIEAIRKGKIK